MKGKNEMKHWKMGDLNQWRRYAGETMEFPVYKPTRITFKVFGTGRFEVWSLRGEDYSKKQLLAVGNDSVEWIEITTADDIAVVVEAPKKAEISVWTRDNMEMVAPTTPDESFANLEPPVLENPDLVRMRKMMARNDQILQEIKAENRKVVQAVEKPPGQLTVDKTETEKEVENDVEGAVSETSDD